MVPRCSAHRHRHLFRLLPQKAPFRFVHFPRHPNLPGLRTNVLFREEGFNQVGMEGNIPQELLRYLKQQNLSTDPHHSAMQRLQSGMDSTLSRSDLGEDEKAEQFLQPQNRYLTFKQQLNTCTPPPAKNRPDGMNTSQSEVKLPTSIGGATTVKALSTSRSESDEGLTL